MSQQTIAKLRRLLAIEVAKREAAEKEIQKAMRIYSENLYLLVDYRMRCEQALKILTGECDD